MTDSPDSALLQRYISERSEAAFAELVRRHLPLVHGAAVRQLAGDSHRAEDVASIVFAELARQAPRLQTKMQLQASLAGWLYVATRNTAVKIIRQEERRKRREREMHMSQEMERAEPGVEHDDWNRIRPALDRALCELKSDDREALLLRFFAGGSAADVARTQRMSEDAARMRIHRALGRLRDRLARRGIESSADALSVLLASTATAAAGVVPTGLHASVAATAVAASASAPPLGALGLLMGALKTKIAAAVIIAAGLAAFFAERSSNREAERRLGSLQKENTQMASAWARREAKAPAEAPPAPAVAVAADGGPPRPRTNGASGGDLGAIPAPTGARASVQLLKDGTPEWEGEPVTLRELLDHLKEFRGRDPKNNGQLMIDSAGAPASQLIYLFDQARRAGIKGAWLDPKSISPDDSASQP